MAKDLYNRYIWLLSTIYRTKRITFKELNNRWVKRPESEGRSIPLKTFHNHKDAIQQIFDITIACEKSSNEYYIENSDEIDNNSIQEWLLSTFSTRNMLQESQEINHRIQLEHVPSGQLFLMEIIEAMKENRHLWISYQSYNSSEPNSFPLAPYFVKLFKQRWYVIGLSDKIRIYAIDRIKSLSVTDDKFNFPTDFDPESYFSTSFGVIGSDEVAAQKVVLRFNRTQSNYVRSLPLHSSQVEIENTPEYSVFEYFIKPTFDFQQEILTHGDAVEVISPQSFRESIKELIGRMSVVYSEK